MTSKNTYLKYSFKVMAARCLA